MKILDNNTALLTMRFSDHVLCDQLAYVHTSISDLKLNINKMTRRTVVQCIDTLQHLKHLMSIDIPEIQSDYPVNNRIT